MSSKGSSQSGSTTPQIPPELSPLVTGSVNQLLSLQNALPLTSFAQATPQMIAGFSPYTQMGIQQTPGLSAVQPGDLGAFQAALAGPEIASQPIPKPQGETATEQLLNYTVGGPIGSSPATQAGMEAWNQRVKPIVQNEAANMGLGRSGQELQSIEQSANDAFFPLIQQEVNDKMTAMTITQQIANAETARFMQPRADTLAALQSQASTLLQAGQQMFDQQVQAIQQQVQAGQLQEDKAQQLYNAALNDYTRLQQLSESATLGPFSALAPSLVGSTSTTKRTPSIMASIFGEK